MKGAPEPSISRLASRESKIIFRAQTNDSGSIENEEILEPGIPYYSIPYYSIPFHTISYYTIPHYSIPYYLILYYSTLFYSIPHYSIPYYSIPYYSIPYYFIRYYSTLFHFVYISQFLCEYQCHTSLSSTSDHLLLRFILLCFLIFTFPLFISLSISCCHNLLLISCYFVLSLTSLSFSS